VGAAITVSGGVYANASGMLIQFFRCAHTCVLLSTHGATNYVTKTADLGHYIKVKLTVHGATGTTPVSLTNWVGPITDAGAGALSITSGARIASVLKVQGSTGVALATVRITRRTGQSVKLAISRTTSTPTSAWVCVISDGAPVSCTVAHTINGALNLSVAVKQGESLKLIAVRSQASAHA
jgi:hypothetical protein